MREEEIKFHNGENKKIQIILEILKDNSGALPRDTLGRNFREKLDIPMATDILIKMVGMNYINTPQKANFPEIELVSIKEEGRQKLLPFYKRSKTWKMLIRIISLVSGIVAAVYSMLNFYINI